MAKTEGVEHPPEEKEDNRGSVAAAAWAAAAKARTCTLAWKAVAQ